MLNQKKRSRINPVSEKQKSVKAKDQEFYKQRFYYSERKCEECGLHLGNVYKPAFISHILSKGAYNRFRFDERNINILCQDCHHIWEFGEKEKMKIYKSNRDLMDKLIREYYTN